MNRRSFVEASAAGLLSRFRVRADAPSGVTRAYSTQAQLEGAVDGPKVTARWTGPGSATWKIEVASADEYEAALCYACAEPGTQLVLSDGKGTLETNTRMTTGFYGDRYNNFERVPCRGSLHLPAGSTELTLRLSKPQGEESMRLRSVELTPVSWKPRLEDEERRATKARASTDWLVKSGYGVMFHWTGQSKPRTGPPNTYAEAVRDFPIKDFVEMVQETGAGHVLFTVNHAIPHCPAPIASWEKVHPGMTTSRDLLGELADALAKANIRFLFYINSPSFGNRAGSPAPSDAQYVDMHCELLNEIGKRYGRKLHGFWFDSWNQPFERYPKVQQERIFEACKTGNPDRITAFNFWIFPVCTPWQEYWAGEVGEPGPPASSRYIKQGAGAGLQFQSLLYLDAPWVHSKPDTEMEPLRFSDEALASYIQSCMQNQGAVTVNLGIYQDASIGPQARQAMRSVRRKIRGS